MKLHRGAFAAALGAVAMVSLAACNGGSSSLNPFAPSRGTARFINASPDAGTVDVAIGKALTPNWTGLPYAGSSQNSATNSNAGISSYIQFNAPTQLIYVYQSGTSNQISVPQSSVTITPNGRTTIVLTGSLKKHNLRLVTFSEHLFKTVAGAASVAFHHASQQFATTKFTVGSQAAGPSDTTSCTASFAPIPPQIIYAVSPPTYQEGLPSNVAGSGIQFCAQGAGQLLTIRPYDVDASDTGNVMPFTGGTSVNGDQNLSIYLIDGPVGSGVPKLIGVFDPDN
jgi:hypothetical protein